MLRVKNQQQQHIRIRMQEEERLAWKAEEEETLVRSKRWPTELRDEIRCRNVRRHLSKWTIVFIVRKYFIIIRAQRYDVFFELPNIFESFFQKCLHMWKICRTFAADIGKIRS